MLGCSDFLDFFILLNEISAVSCPVGPAVSPGLAKGRCQRVATACMRRPRGSGPCWGDVGEGASAMGQASASLQAPPTPVASGVSFSNKPQAPPDGTGREGQGRGPAASSILVSGRERRPGPVMRVLPGPQPHAPFLRVAPIRAPPDACWAVWWGSRRWGAPGSQRPRRPPQFLGAVFILLALWPQFSRHPICTTSLLHTPARVALGKPGEGSPGRCPGRGLPPATAGPGSSRPHPSLHPRGLAKLWLPRGAGGVRALQLLQEVPADGLIWPGVLGPGGI